MGSITIVGLGPGAFGLMTVETLSLLETAPTLLFRTSQHPTVEELQRRGITFSSYDHLYEQQETFDAVYRAIVEDCLQRVAAGQDVVYAVPGSPLVAERTVILLREQADKRDIPLRIVPGMSFLEVLYTRLGVDPIEGVTVVDAGDIVRLPPDLATALVITQVYNRQVASDAKLALMERYPDEYPAIVVRNLGLPDEQLISVPLYEMDRLSVIDHLTSVYIPARPPAAPFSLTPLQDVMATLRSPDGCVWDLAQTHQSLRRYLLEEVHEVFEAIDLEDADQLCEELGDVLLQIVFHARMAEESGSFSLQDVIDGVTAKMVRRHPHVFGETTVQDAGEVVLNWEELKRQEKAGMRLSVLDGIPRDLPGLHYAQKLQEKAAKVGFDWPEIAPVWDKLQEEIDELRQAAQQGNRKAVEDELGDVVFAAVNLARFLGVDAELAIRGTSRKFQRRFAYIESQVAAKGLTWQDLTLESLDLLWDEAKKSEK